MKKFQQKNGKEIVILQGKDLNFLDSQSRTPKSIKKLIGFEHISYTNREVEYEFQDKEIVEFAKTADYILDSDKFGSLSHEEKLQLLLKKANEINDLAKEVNYFLKRKLDDAEVSKVRKKRHDLAECRYCYESIIYVLEEEQKRELAKKQGKKFL